MLTKKCSLGKYGRLRLRPSFGDIQTLWLHAHWQNKLDLAAQRHRMSKTMAGRALEYVIAFRHCRPQTSAQSNAVGRIINDAFPNCVCLSGDTQQSGWSQSLDVPQRSYKIYNPAVEPTFETITHLFLKYTLNILYRLFYQTHCKHLTSSLSYTAFGQYYNTVKIEL